MDIRKSIEQSQELVSNRILLENACEVCERTFRESKTLRYEIHQDHENEGHELEITGDE